MSVYVYEAIESAMEVFCQYLLMLVIDRSSGTRSFFGTGLLIAGVTTVSLTFSYFTLPFTTIFVFLSYALLLYLLSEQSILRILQNTTLSLLAFFLLEFCGLGVFRSIWSEGFVDDHRRVLLLLGILLLVSLGLWRLVPALPLHRPLQGGHLPMTVLLCGDILVAVSIVTNLWSRDSAAFFADFGSILLQIGLFCLITCTLGYLLAGNAAQRARNKVMTEYNALLEQTMEDMRQREHEYKNELNVILSIAEHRESYSLDMIGNYVQQLYAEAKDQPPVTLVRGNTVVSFLLLRYRQMANRQEIPFSAEVCDPFPAYPIPEKDLLEMVSNLLNNAFEATAELPETERSALIKFEPNRILVENTFPSSGGDLSDLNRIMERGRSTKGSGRGYGLSNVMKVAHRYRLKTEIYREGNRFSFLVHFPKN